MSESTYSQRYASGDSLTAGAFAFDTISSKDYAVSKLAFGAVGAVTYVSASDPLPVTISGVATAALQTTGNGYLATVAGAVSGTEMQVDVLTMPTVTIQDGGGSLTVDGTVAATQSGSWTVGVSGTVAVSAAALPLPSGAATAAKQPALGTAGTASSDVLTVQGIASMTALKVDGSAVTQPVSGTVSAAQSGTWTVQPGNTANTTAWLVTGTGGTFPVTDSGGSITVDDGSGSLTVDGSVSITGTVAVTDNSGSLTVDDGGATLSIDDGGGSITVDGTVSLSGTVTVDSELTTADLDTGAGTDTRAVVGLVLAASGGGLLVGAANPMPVSDNGGSLTVDNGGTFAVQVDGTALTRLTDIETNTDSGAVVGNGAAATAQRVTLANDSTGIVALTTSTASIGKLAANTGVTIGAVEIAATQTLATVTTVTTVSTLTGGGVAHDAADSGNPHKIGAKAETSPKGITLVADGDRTDLYADADGQLMVKLNTSGADVISEAVSNTDGASTAFTNFSAVASTKNYITAYHIFRTDAGTTPIYVDFRDGTGGSVLWRAVLPPNGGANSPACAGPALFKTSANTALAFDVSAATTTVYLNVSGYQSKV